jgi:phosphoribosylformylglycinamidine cyclo-ligase
VQALSAIKSGGVTIKACSHITGGGFYENIPRMLREGVHARVYKDSYEVPAIFKMLSTDGSIEEKIMYNTYNMGIGMIIAVDSTQADKTLELLKAAGEVAYIVGEITSGEKGVTIC